jgi:hypothetical protein
MTRPAVRRLPPLALLAAVVLATVGSAGAATLQITGPPGAEVTLDGRSLGLLPLSGPMTVEPGVYLLGCRLSGHRDVEQSVVIAEPESWQHVRLRPLPLRRSEAVTSSLLFAGLGQWYRGDRWRGWVYFLGEAGGLLTAVAGEVQRENFRQDYLTFRESYESALSADQIAFWRTEADQAYRDMQDMADLRDTGLYVAAGAWVLSLLDAWLLTPSVDVGPGVVPPSAAHAAVGDDPTDLAAPGAVHAGVTLGF